MLDGDVEDIVDCDGRATMRMLGDALSHLHELGALPDGSNARVLVGLTSHNDGGTTASVVTVGPPGPSRDNTTGCVFGRAAVSARVVSEMSS